MDLWLHTFYESATNLLPRLQNKKLEGFFTNQQLYKLCNKDNYKGKEE